MFKCFMIALLIIECAMFIRSMSYQGIANTLQDGQRAAGRPGATTPEEARLELVKAGIQ